MAVAQSLAHQPVLLSEVLQHLLPELVQQKGFDGEASARVSGRYLDATFGRGGHARALLAQLATDASLIVMDRDPEAVAAANTLAATDSRVQVLDGPMSKLDELLARNGLPVAAELGLNGILADLGVSSPQLDDPARGFSLRSSGPLDMRMDNTHGSTVAQWLQAASEDEITRVLKSYGEQPAARRIARAIIAARPIDDTQRLADIIAEAVPAAIRRRGGSRHPATQSFQALRIHINDELGEVQAALPKLFSALAIGGRLAVISFHSLEDRLVKRFFRSQTQRPNVPRRLPVPDAALPPAAAKAIAGPIRASERELTENPRARSATLRVLERIS
ncbi:MAG: 16S rRNA (cytosine(1402)-N(4))-methyltransferase RsmH [Pseudomonadales bacterium]